FDDEIESIQPEPVDAAVEPETHGIQDGITNFRIPPVQIRLLFQEGVQVILPRLLVVLPCATSEDADPVVGRGTVGPWILPDVPVPPGIIPGGSRGLEPRMLRRCVVGHPIEDHAEIAAMSLLEQGIEIFESAEARIHIDKVAGIVAHLQEGRVINRREPDCIYANPLKVLQFAGYADQIAEAIPVRIIIGGYEELVDDCSLPPGLRIGHACTRLRVNVAARRALRRLQTRQSVEQRCGSGCAFDFPTLLWDGVAFGPRTRAYACRSICRQSVDRNSDIVYLYEEVHMRS